MLPTFPSRYWYTIGLLEVFSLAGWSPQIQTGFHVSRPTQVALSSRILACTGVSPSAPRLSGRFQFRCFDFNENSYNPAASVNATVWATSLSIATTQDIDFSFSSSGY